MLLALTVCLALAAGAATAFWPWLGVLVLACLLPLDYPLEIGVTVFSQELILALVLLGFGVSLLRTRSWRSISWETLLAGIPYLGAIAISAVNAVSPASVIKQDLRWLQLVAIVWYTANAFQDRAKIRWVINALILSGLAAGLLGLAQSLAGPDSFLNFNHSIMMLYQNQLRAYGTFGHPNQFAGYLLWILPLAVAQFFLAAKGSQRLAWAFACLVLATALMLTYTRGAWISLSVAGLAWIYLRAPLKVTLRLTAVLLIVGTVFWFATAHQHGTHPSFAQRAASLTRPGGEDSVNFRLVCLKTGLRMFAAHPWVGFGAGEYGLNIKKYFPPDYYAWEALGKHIHNLFLQILIESGLLGLLGFLVYLAFLAMKLVQALSAQPRRPDHFWLEAVAVGFLAYVLANQFDVLTIFGRGMYAGLVLGLGLACLNLPQAPEAEIAGTGAGE